MWWSRVWCAGREGYSRWSSPRDRCQVEAVGGGRVAAAGRVLPPEPRAILFTGERTRGQRPATRAPPPHPRQHRLARLLHTPNTVTCAVKDPSPEQPVTPHGRTPRTEGPQPTYRLRTDHELGVFQPRRRRQDGLGASLNRRGTGSFQPPEATRYRPGAAIRCSPRRNHRRRHKRACRPSHLSSGQPPDALTCAAAPAGCARVGVLWRAREGWIAVPGRSSTRPNRRR